MQARFFGQPQDDGSNLRDFFEQVAQTEGLTRLDVAVAWAKESGLSRVADQILAIRDRGDARILLGIDKGGATEQGLRAARRLFDLVEVVHRNGAVTFHPKVYLARGDDNALVFIGSNNLTAGGAYSNYEAGLVLDLDLAEVPDAAVLDEVEQYFELLRGDTETCKVLNDELLEALLTNPRYDIADEAQTARASNSAGDDDPANAGDASPPTGEPSTPALLFGKSAIGSRKDPGRSKVAIASGETEVDPAAHPGQPSAEPPPRLTRPTSGPPAAGPQSAIPDPLSSEVSPSVTKRWTKELTHSDAQQKKTPATKVTGNLKLTEAGHPIDHTDYFRHDFFSTLTWIGHPKPKGTLETADVPVELIVNGVSQGTFDMVVDHADYRISDQANVPTWLKWKAASGYMKGHHHVGDWVSLERLDTGNYRLQIAPGPTGLFLP